MESNDPGNSLFEMLKLVRAQSWQYMLRFFLLKFSLLLAFVPPVAISFGQNAGTDKHPSKTKKNVKLVSWKSLDCDNTYDPYRLISRITDFEVRNSQTFITVNFSDNCCLVFKPKIEFKENKLLLEAYEKYPNEICDCNCCFSMQFQIEGLPERGYEVYFKDKKIERSADHYKVFETSYEEYDGQIINRRNKYGFNEGIWITFYDDGKVREIFNYPENELYRESRPIWSKEFYPSGVLSYFDRKDTTESWFEDGELQAQFIEYEKADTTFNYRFIKHPNRNPKEKYLDKSYPTIFTSEFDSDYRGEGSRLETVYAEEYFENGQRKFLYGMDTSYSWYESGQVKFKQYKDGKVKYASDGFVTQKLFHWRTAGGKGSRDMENSLYVDFNENGTISRIEYVRDEPTKRGWAPDVRYEWKWNADMKSLSSPKGWREEFPWKRFPELSINTK